jgi:hypothetical protein
MIKEHQVTRIISNRKIVYPDHFGGELFTCWSRAELMFLRHSAA